MLPKEYDFAACFAALYITLDKDPLLSAEVQEKMANNLKAGERKTIVRRAFAMLSHPKELAWH